MYVYVSCSWEIPTTGGADCSTVSGSSTSLSRHTNHSSHPNPLRCVITLCVCVYFDIVAVAYRPEPIMEGVSKLWNVVVGSCCDTIAIPCYDAKLNAPWHCVCGPLVHTQPKHEVGREVRSSKPHAM